MNKHETLVQQTLDYAKKQGATDCEVMLNLTQGQDVSARKGDVENVEFTRARGLGVTVYVGQKKAAVGTSDIHPSSVHAAVDKALDMANAMEADIYAGLPDKADLATEFRNLDAYHPWNLDSEQAIEKAIALEAKALRLDSRIKQSDGVHVSTRTSQGIYGNSLGFLHSTETTRHGLTCIMIAEHEGNMQRDYGYDSKRDPADLMSEDTVAQMAVERTVRRLGAKPVKTQSCDVIFEANVASSLLSHLISAISGGALYRKSSFLCDALGEQLFPEFVRIHEDPFLPKGLGSACFDLDGVQTQARDIIEQGVLKGYVLSTYSARRLNLKTTGNAGGVHNLTIEPGSQDLTGMIQAMGRGLLVTELMGQGVNLVTGDYSRGASGFWVENGAIQHPVEGVTIAGNLRDMFKGLTAVGCDVDNRGNIRTPSLWLSKMMLAGA